MANGPDSGVISREDARSFEAAMRDLTASAEDFGEAFSASMRRAVIAGRDLDDTLRGLALRLSDLALERALRPVDQLAGNLLSGLAGGFGPEGSGTGGSATVGKSAGQLAGQAARLLGGASRRF